jgi:nicotinamidase/pyrazinamidase
LLLGSGYGLIVVDVQNDFLPGGSLAVPQGDEIIPVLNKYLDIFLEKELPVFATRDWHPPDHCSFRTQGGPWPPHCIAGTGGSEFTSDILLPAGAIIIPKGMDVDKDAYSGFQGTDLDRQLRSLHVQRLFIGGLATDYCVLNTVKDALELEYEVHLLLDAVRAVNVKPEDGKKAIEEMTRLGAVPLEYSMLSVDP